MAIHTLTNGGASCQIHSDGAQVTSWVPAQDEERLFLSPRSAFGRGASIRGGAPVIFPQFNAWGPYARHGFARRTLWEFLGQGADADGRVKARLELRESVATLTEWPFVFRCVLTVALGERELEIGLRVENTGRQAFRFSAALHTYFAVADIAGARLAGLDGAPYFDSAGGQVKRVQQERDLAFEGYVDRIYFGAPQQLVLREGGRSLAIEQRGFSDTVVWNPGEEKGAELRDLEAGGWRKFACIEAAVIDPPVTLGPGGDWSGAQHLRA